MSNFYEDFVAKTTYQFWQTSTEKHKMSRSRFVVKRKQQTFVDASGWREYKSFLQAAAVKWHHVDVDQGSGFTLKSQHKKRNRFRWKKEISSSSTTLKNTHHKWPVSVISLQYLLVVARNF